jgi:hypothetical protein
MEDVLKEMECCICLGSLFDDWSVSQPTQTAGDVAALQCGHLFHQACVMQHLEHNANCPLCRLATKEWVTLSTASPPSAPAAGTYHDELRARAASAREQHTTVANRVTALQERASEMQDEQKFVATAIFNMRRELTLMEAVDTSANRRATLRQAAREAMLALQGLEVAQAQAFREGSEIEEKIAKLKRKRERTNS